MGVGNYAMTNPMANQMPMMDYNTRMSMPQQYPYGPFNQPMYNYQMDYDPSYDAYYQYSANMTYPQSAYYPGYSHVNPQAPPVTIQGTSKPRAEPAKSVPSKSEEIINVNVVVAPPPAQKGKEVAKGAPKTELKRPEPVKEQKKEIKKGVKEAAALTKPKEAKGAAQKPKEIKKEIKKEVKKETKKAAKQKEEKPEVKKEITDMIRFTDITKNTKNNVLTYEVILRIGKELLICQKKPSFLLDDVLTREVESRDLSTGRKTEIKLQRRAKTEIEILIDNEAKAQKKKLEESASKDDKEGELIFALNRLTPDNYSVLFKSIWELTSGLQETAVDAIFKKAWRETDYIPLYGTLCKEIICTELKRPLDSKLEKEVIVKSSIRSKILNKCHETFRERAELKKRIIKNSKKELTPEEIDYFHRKMFFGSTLFAYSSNNVCGCAVQPEPDKCRNHHVDN
eukprot:TRINITY_DN10925_c0_g3_i1.p1 TRINITY_DN10925_c0_g3~~TRINITY_DN10925_c0_g3_i1.p1  ORF type:complete len:454 (-),score=134.59 TRINITY_DN10925_c0_g3_i1:1697-3058(-)